VTALREAVRRLGGDAALLAARVLGIWGHHAGAAAICRDALGGPPVAGSVADQLEAELFAADVISAATTGQARARARSRLSDPGTPDTWRIHGALLATMGSGGEALTRLAPVLATGLRDVPPDSIIAVYALLALIWDDELTTASGICDTVLAAARGRGSMSMVAHASCLRSMIMRRLGRLEEAAADARLALDFKLATSPPLAVAWAALGAENPAIASWRTAAAEAHRALGQHDQAAALAAEQLALARLLGRPPGPARHRAAGARAHVRSASAGGPPPPPAAPRGGGGGGPPPPPEPAGCLESLAEAVSVLEPTPARYDLALALADYGACLRRAGQRTQARGPLRRALDLAERAGAAGLAAEVRRDLLAAGARPRRAALTGPDALTASERRVASLAAGGPGQPALTNRQIAEHLFITQATVETHLRHAFGKLGITSRAGLGLGLGDDSR